MPGMTGAGAVTVQTDSMGRWAQILIIPISASGTVSIEGKVAGSESFLPINDSEGVALTELAMSGEIVRIVDNVRFTEIKVTSTNAADVFKVHVEV